MFVVVTPAVTAVPAAPQPRTDYKICNNPCGWKYILENLLLMADGTPQLRTPQWHEKWYHLQPVHRAAAWPRQSLHCHFYFSSAPPPIVLCIGCSLRNIIEEKFWSWYKINVCKSARSPSLWYLNCEPITGPVLGWGLYWDILAILATGYWIMIWEQSPSPP